MELTHKNNRTYLSSGALNASIYSTGSCDVSVNIETVEQVRFKNFPAGKYTDGFTTVEIEGTDVNGSRVTSVVLLPSGMTPKTFRAFVANADEIDVAEERKNRIES